MFQLLVSRAVSGRRGKASLRSSSYRAVFASFADGLAEFLGPEGLAKENRR